MESHTAGPRASGVSLSVMCSRSVHVVASVSASPAFHGRVTLPRVDGPRVGIWGVTPLRRRAPAAEGGVRARVAGFTSAVPWPSGAAGPSCQVRARRPLCPDLCQLGLVGSLWTLGAAGPFCHTCPPYQCMLSPCVSDHSMRGGCRQRSGVTLSLGFRNLPSIRRRSTRKRRRSGPKTRRSPGGSPSRAMGRRGPWRTARWRRSRSR